ncbi:MAG: serine/threonine protein kinase [Planctomycetota bacterium]|jgi:serine/threonine-protein kinase|nr:serine/threonine protein kinase [Planctomycetota bacterium]
MTQDPKNTKKTPPALEPTPHLASPPPPSPPEPRILVRERQPGPLPTLPGLAGNYRVRRLIGRGGMASVYLAEQTSMARPVALKILSPDLAAKPDFVDRFLREARVSARLNHPNIVAAIDFGEVDSRFFLAMELVEGRTLRAILDESGPLTEKAAAEIGWQMLQALSHAARHNVLHLDVKPANIIIQDEGGAAKLTDFGLAMLLDKPAASDIFRHSVGTPHYMAPEQIEGGGLDWRTDQFALGATLYEATTGRKPFPGNSVADILRRRFFEKPPPAWRVGSRRAGRGFSLVLARMLARSPDARYQSFQELLDDFDRIRRGGRPVHAAAEGVPPAGPEWGFSDPGRQGPDARLRTFLRTRRRPFLIRASLAALALLIGFALIRREALSGPRPPPHWRADLAAEAEQPGRDSGQEARKRWSEACRLVREAENRSNPETLRQALEALRLVAARRDLAITAYAAEARQEISRLEAELEGE